MSKTKIRPNVAKWKPVVLDEVIISSKEFEGLVGIEELTDYSTLDVKVKRKKRKVKKGSSAKSTKDNGNSEEESENDEPTKVSTQQCKKKKKKSKIKNKLKVTNNNICKKNETVQPCNQERENGELAVTSSDSKNGEMPPEMEAWSGLGVPNVLLRALADSGFTSPTEIQALTLPSAIFGRRDILGAAETGSGKTLAFGIPLLHGILIHKEKNENSLSPEKGIDLENNIDEGEELYLEDNVDEGEELDLEDNTDEGEELDLKDDTDGEGTYERDSEGDEEEENIKDEEGSETLGCVKVVDNIHLDFALSSKPTRKTKYIPKPLYALVLTPTRELAVQVKKHLVTAAKYTKIKIAVVVGGLAPQKQERILNQAPEVVVATPGRLWELIQMGHPHLKNVENIKFLAIDETDRMLERGHFAELQQLLERINMNEAQKKVRQNFVFSATLTLTHDPPRYVNKKKKGKGKSKQQLEGNRLTPAQKLTSIMETVGLTNPKIVDVTQSSGVAHSLTEARIVCSLEEKDYYLYYFLQRHPGRTLIFCNSIGCVKRLAQLFSILECSPWPLHASMHQKQRLKNLERFTEDPRGVLLATDVAARGLDIPNVQHVIHYQVPRTAESYVHRSGRTARARQAGLTVVIMEPGEVKNYNRLFHTLGRDPELPMFPVENQWLSAVKQRVNAARDLDKLELHARRITAEQGWLDKAVLDMDLEISDDEIPTNLSRQGSNELKKKAKECRKRLSILLKKPLIPKGFSSKYPTEMGGLSMPFFPGGITSSGVVTSVQAAPAASAVEALQRAVEYDRAEKRKINNERSKRNKKKRKLSHQSMEEVQGGEEDEKLEEQNYESDASDVKAPLLQKQQKALPRKKMGKKMRKPNHSL